MRSQSTSLLALAPAIRGIVACCALVGLLVGASAAEVIAQEKQPRNPFDRLNEKPAEGEPPADAPAAPAAPAEGAAPAPPAAGDDDEPAVEAAPIYERFPFDRIYVKESLVKGGDPPFHEVQKLELPGRVRPESPRSGDKLVFKFLDNPEEQFEIRWGDVDRLELFEEMVLAEAQQRLDAGRLVEAFKYFQHLDRFYPNFPGVKQAVEAFLYKDAVAQAKDKKSDVALAVLGELFERNRDYPGLQRAMSATVSKLIEEQVRKKNFLEARRLLRDLTDKYPEDKAGNDWAGRFAKEAEKRLAEAKQLLAAKKLSEAQHAVTDAVRVWPTLPEARAMAVEQNKRYPVVTIGVTALPQERPGRAGWNSLATLRGERLLERQLIELNDYDRNGEGGVYVCPFGQIERAELGLSLAIRLQGDVRWSDGSGLLTGYDVSQTLLAMANPTSPTYRADWRELFTSVAVNNVHQVDLRLQRTHVRPDALLQTSVVPWARVAESAERVTNGPYRAAARSEAGIRYRYQPKYFALGETQPREVEERLFTDGKQALRALADGEIAVLDRVNPWQLGEVAEIPRVKVAPYAVPTVHCLWPNLKRPFIEHRSFRRALIYGIHRDAILKKVLLRGREGEHLAECQTLTAPFPRGYAYNEKIPFREYDGRQAVTLARIVQYSILKKAEKDKKVAAPGEAPPAAPQVSATSAAPGEARIIPVAATLQQGEGEAADEDAKPAETPAESQLPPLPTFVLAHPPTELAQKACGEIQRHLAAIQVQITLRELPADQLLAMPEDVDLVYVELPVREPVVDARRLLGSDGLVGTASPYMDLALRQLADATDWKSARDRLFYVHQLAHDELTLLPLWQMTEFFAYREDVRGMARRPVNLYQSIENWQVPPWFPPDAK